MKGRIIAGLIMFLIAIGIALTFILSIQKTSFPKDEKDLWAHYQKTDAFFGRLAGNNFSAQRDLLIIFWPPKGIAENKLALVREYIILGRCWCEAGLYVFFQMHYWLWLLFISVFFFFIFLFSGRKKSPPKRNREE